MQELYEAPMLYWIISPNRMKPNLAKGVLEPTNEAIQLYRVYYIEEFLSVETQRDLHARHASV